MKPNFTAKIASALITILPALFFPVLDPGALKAAPVAAAPLRQTISLDGTWQIAEGRMDIITSDFSRAVPVPGLVDMADPPFVEPGPKVADRNQVSQSDARRSAFWYRRSFKVQAPIPAVAAQDWQSDVRHARLFNGRLPR